MHTNCMQTHHGVSRDILHIRPTLLVCHPRDANGDQRAQPCLQLHRLCKARVVDNRRSQGDSHLSTHVCRQPPLQRFAVGYFHRILGGVQALDWRRDGGCYPSRRGGSLAGRLSGRDSHDAVHVAGGCNAAAKQCFSLWWRVVDLALRVSRRRTCSASTPQGMACSAMWYRVHSAVMKECGLQCVTLCIACWAPWARLLKHSASIDCVVVRE